MIVTLKNWILMDIVGLIVRGSLRVIAVAHAKKKWGDIKMDPPEKTL